MKFKAFFSYAREDDKLANWLHKKLDNYRVPKPLVGIEGEHGLVLAKLHPIFRDRTDLSGGGQLTDKLDEALQNSERLIVLCSPAAAKSEWVNKEIERFIQLGRSDNIYPVIASHCRESDDLEHDFYPPALRGKGVLASDLRDIKKPNGKIVGDGKDGGMRKLLAGALGVELDKLVQRERARERRQKAIAIFLAGVMTVLAIAATGGGVFSYLQFQEAQHQRNQALTNESIARSEDVVDLTEAGNGAQGVALAASILPTSDIDRPYVVEAEAALMLAAQSSSQGKDLSSPDKTQSRVFFRPDARLAVVTGRDINGRVHARLHDLQDSAATRELGFALEEHPKAVVFYRYDDHPAVSLIMQDPRTQPRYDQAVPSFVFGSDHLVPLDVAPVSEIVRAGGLPLLATDQIINDGLSRTVIRRANTYLSLDKTTGELNEIYGDSKLVAASADHELYAWYDGVQLALEHASRAITEAPYSDIRDAHFTLDGKLLIRHGTVVDLLARESFERLSRTDIGSDTECSQGEFRLRDFDLTLVSNNGTAICEYELETGLIGKTHVPRPAEHFSPDGKWAVDNGKLFATFKPVSNDAFQTLSDFGRLNNCDWENADLANACPYRIEETRMDDELGGRIVDVFKSTNGERACRITLAESGRVTIDERGWALFPRYQFFDLLRCENDANLIPEDRFYQGDSVDTGAAPGLYFTGISTDGQRVLTMGAEETLKLWRISTADLLWETDTLPTMLGGETVDDFAFSFHETGKYVPFIPTPFSSILEHLSVTPPTEGGDAMVGWPALAQTIAPIDIRPVEIGITACSELQNNPASIYVDPVPFATVTAALDCVGLLESAETNLQPFDTLEIDILFRSLRSRSRASILNIYPWIADEDITDFRVFFRVPDE